MHQLVHFRGSHLVRSLSCNFAMIARAGVWTAFAMDISAYNADHTFFSFRKKGVRYAHIYFYKNIFVHIVHIDSRV